MELCLKLSANHKNINGRSEEFWKQFALIFFFFASLSFSFYSGKQIQHLNTEFQNAFSVLHILKT